MVKNRTIYILSIGLVFILFGCTENKNSPGCELEDEFLETKENLTRVMKTGKVSEVKKFSTEQGRFSILSETDSLRKGGKVKEFINLINQPCIKSYIFVNDDSLYFYRTKGVPVRYKIENNKYLFDAIMSDK